MFYACGPPRNLPSALTVCLFVRAVSGGRPRYQTSHARELRKCCAQSDGPPGFLGELVTGLRVLRKWKLEDGLLVPVAPMPTAGVSGAGSFDGMCMSSAAIPPGEVLADAGGRTNPGSKHGRQAVRCRGRAGGIRGCAWSIVSSIAMGGADFTGYLRHWSKPMTRERNSGRRGSPGRMPTPRFGARGLVWSRNNYVVGWRFWEAPRTYGTATVRHTICTDRLVRPRASDYDIRASLRRRCAGRPHLRFGGEAHRPQAWGVAPRRKPLDRGTRWVIQAPLDIARSGIGSWTLTLIFYAFTVGGSPTGCSGDG
jgi:hypothetical protein